MKSKCEQVCVLCVRRGNLAPLIFWNMLSKADLIFSTQKVNLMWVASILSKRLLIQPRLNQHPDHIEV